MRTEHSILICHPLIQTFDLLSISAALESQESHSALDESCQRVFAQKSKTFWRLIRRTNQFDCFPKLR